MLRQERFSSHILHSVRAQDILNQPVLRAADAVPLSNHEVWQTIQGLINPVPPEGYSRTPRELRNSMPNRSSGQRAIEAVDESWMLLQAT